MQKESLESFKIKVQKIFDKGAYVKEAIDPEITGELRFSNIGFDLTALVKKFEPYGQGNSKPKFIFKQRVWVKRGNICVFHLYKTES